MSNKSCKRCGLKVRRKRGTSKNRKNNHKKNTKRYRLYKVGGGCGCGNSDMKPWIGGENQDIDTGKIPGYTYNNLEIDPSSPGAIVSTRNLPDIVNAGGGRSKRNNKMNRSAKNKKRSMKIRLSSKKQLGGDAFLGQNPNMPITSFGTTSGAYDFYNIEMMNNGVNPAPYVQPVSNMYGDHNYPLV